MLYLNRIKWALRKLWLKTGNGLVLDVGSGGRPYPRSDVLLDRMTGSEHRCGEGMMLDGRIAVFGDATRMPFKDKAFDYIIASHILEHIADPEKFILELQRVGKAGYIETPNAIFERLDPHRIHCLEIFNLNNKLHIYKKECGGEGSFFGLTKIFKNDRLWAKLFNKNPQMFHVRYFWTGSINYKIYNNDVSCDWIEKINSDSSKGYNKKSYIESVIGWREIGQTILHYYYSTVRKVRLRDFNIDDILACPNCHGELSSIKFGYCCNSCKKTYTNDIAPDFTK